MKRIFLIIIALIYMTDGIMYSKDGFNPPPTKKIPVVDTVHGFIFTDYYRWLEDKNNPEVKDWSHKQHEYTVNYIKTKTPEINGLKDEIRNYIDRDYIGAPFYKDNREFFYARKKGEQQNKLYTRLNGKEILIFDPMKFDPEGKAAISGLDMTEDAEYAAVGIQYKGNEISEYRIIDTKTGRIIGKPIQNVYDFTYRKDNKSVYLTIRTQEMIDKQIAPKTYIHVLGEDHSKDIFLFAPKDAKDVADVNDAEEGDYTIYTNGDFYSNTIRIQKIGSKENPKQIYSSTKYIAHPHVKGDKIYIRTNYEAPNFKLMVADVNHPEFENWKTLIPEKETVLENIVVTSDYIIASDKKDVLSRLSVYDLNGKFLKELPLPEIANVAGIGYQKETNELNVSLSTFTSPSKLYKVNGKTLEWKFVFQDNPQVDTKDIESKLVFYPSKDGTKIPMFIVYKRGMKQDGNNPTMLYGYGGFNISMSPNFVGTTASFINRGGIYAIACIRGGNEYGENWHLNGMLDKKQNTFDDFIAAGEYLIKENYTNTNKLLCKGGSNGGLLIGAVVTQRPDLFKAAVCSVPLLDMVRFHKFLIARYWIPEYGDPDKREDLINIMKYSPYQNIKAGFNYPTMLVKAGENDTRVDALHAKKFAAALQNNPSQYNPIMLFIDFESGHGTGQSIEQQVENISLEWRFVMSQLNMNRIQ